MTLPFESQQETSPGFRPVCKISTPDGGGSGDIPLDMAASLLGAPQDDQWAKHLRSAELILAPAPYLSTARLHLAIGAEAPKLALGDELKVALGYDDTLHGVFTGTVLMLNEGGQNVLEILLCCGGHALAQSRQYLSFENQGLGDILKQWAEEASLESGTIENGPQYPFLAIDDSRSLWEWSSVLAAHAGAWVWTDSDNKLNFKKPGESGNRSYGYGTDLISLRVSERGDLFGEVTVSGEGSAGSQGTPAWSWLTKRPDPISATAGEGQPKRLYQNGALRNQEAAQSYSDALETRAEQLRHVVKASVPGCAELGLGQTFDLTACPGGRGNGSYIITRVRHRYDNRGFITELSGVAA